jgi:hypothetical protein
VIAGMSAATLLGIFFIPALFVLVEKFASRKHPPGSMPAAVANEHGSNDRHGSSH